MFVILVTELDGSLSGGKRLAEQSEPHRTKAGKSEADTNSDTLSILRVTPW